MIKLKNVSLQVPVSSYSSFTLFELLKTMIFRQKRKIFQKSDWIISDVSFELKTGDKVGIIGRNGAGKSSLLRLISGMYSPTMGEIEVVGDVLPLLELGAGFQPEFTGRENLHLNGAILGYSSKEISLLEQQIINFAGIEESIDIPIKYYSSGMGARLAFAMVTSLMPDILILDEVFAAGDKFFHKQALDKINSLIGSANIVIIVSHNIPFVRQTCEKILWLEQGKLFKQGGLELLEEYENLQI